MKNSKDYGGKIKKLFREWKRGDADLTPAVYEEPLEALVVAMISEHRGEADAQKIYKRMQGHFTDLNDLRVSRTEEILEIMNDHSEAALATAQIITQVFNQVYDRYDVMSLAALKSAGKRQGRKELEELNGLSRFAVDYCFVTALGGHAIPLTESMKSLLRREGLVHSEATDDEIHGFLERQISAADGWAFYTLLRNVAEGMLTAQAPADGQAAESPAAPKTVKKTKKQTSSKKSKTGGKSVAKK